MNLYCDSEIGAGAVINNSMIEESTVADGDSGPTPTFKPGLGLAKDPYLKLSKSKVRLSEKIPKQVIWLTLATAKLVVTSTLVLELSRWITMATSLNNDWQQCLVGS